MTISAYGYIRVSTSAQAATSFPRQQRSIEDWCDSQGIELKEVYSDVMSAYHKDPLREGNLAKLADKIIKNEILPGSWIVAETYDRISRSPGDAFFWTIATQKGINLHFYVLGEPKKDPTQLRLPTVRSSDRGICILSIDCNKDENNHRYEYVWAPTDFQIKTRNLFRELLMGEETSLFNYLPRERPRWYDGSIGTQGKKAIDYVMQDYPEGWKIVAGYPAPPVAYMKRNKK